MQLLDNLVLNALTHGQPAPADASADAPADVCADASADAPAAVELHAHRDASATPPVLVLAVRDRGPGVPPAERERIFQAFERGSTPAGGPLNAAGDQLWPVGALALPPEATLAAARASGAVALFEARARAADPRFTLTPENLPAVLDICRSLDGLALALVLAAATVPVLGVAGLQARLHERLGWTQRAGLPGAARHLSLQHTLDWSHELLGADEQRLFSALGVFAGSFALPAAQQVLAADGMAPGAVVQALQGLIAHSLLVLDTASLLAGSGWIGRGRCGRRSTALHLARSRAPARAPAHGQR